MSGHEFRTVDLRQASAISTDIAALFAREIKGLDPARDTEVYERYVGRLSLPTITTHGLFDQDGSLLAASSIELGHIRREEVVTKVHAVAVQPSLRHRGLGETMLQHIAEEAIDHGDPILELTCYDQELFYRRLGFVRVNDTDYEAKPGRLLAIVAERAERKQLLRSA